MPRRENRDFKIKLSFKNNFFLQRVNLYAICKVCKQRKVNELIPSLWILIKLKRSEENRKK